MNIKDILNGLTFSDMHLMLLKGDFKGIKANLIRLISRYDVVFYNGDIFELFYGKYLAKEGQSLAHAQHKAAKAALKKMDKLIQATPNTHHCYILGNHEDVQEFKDRLNELAAKYANFQWHAKYARYQDMLFLHGDLPMGGNPEQREAYPLQKIPFTNIPLFEKNPFMNIAIAKVYDQICKRFEPQFLELFDNTINRPEEVCRKTVEYLRKHHPEQLEGVRHIFIGHTHKPFEMRYDGYVIHNTGTLAVDKRDYPVELEINTRTGMTETRNLPSHVLRQGWRPGDRQLALG